MYLCFISNSIAAINCILSVLYVHDDANFSDIALRHPIADLVFFMLPKIVYTCRNVAIGDEKQGETIIIVSEISWHNLTFKQNILFFNFSCRLKRLHAFFI